MYNNGFIITKNKKNNRTLDLFRATIQYMQVTLQKISPDKFPPKLKEIPDAPQEIFIEGIFPDPAQHIFLGVVGPRKHSDYGKAICKDLIKGLAGQPIVIVSGLALGIDTIAHTTALEAGLPTVAVPGSGLAPQALYPKSNFQLARTIVASGGVLLSEFEPEFKAAPWSFPKRNRIVAGLCDAVLVIEASEKSGALITAKLATNFGRDVLAVPGSVFSEQSKGTNRLIAQGAFPITSAQDIIQHFNLAQESKSNGMLFESFTEQEIAVLRLLSEPRTKNYIYEYSGLSSSECSIVLSSLEIKNAIYEELGKIYRPQ